MTMMFTFHGYYYITKVFVIKIYTLFQYLLFSNKT